MHNFRKQRRLKRPAREAVVISPRLDTIREEETMNVEPLEEMNETQKLQEESSLQNIIDAADTQIDSKKNQTFATNFHIRSDDIFKSPLENNTTQQDRRPRVDVQFQDLDAMFESVSVKEEDQGCSDIRVTTPVSDKSEVVQPSNPKDLSGAYKRKLNRRMLRKFKATLRIEKQKEEDEEY